MTACIRFHSGRHAISASMRLEVNKAGVFWWRPDGISEFVLILGVPKHIIATVPQSNAEQASVRRFTGAAKE
jgi:hypothetical protein